ncbi:prominin-1-A-like isoform X1, partial [Paramuricea clavata]
SVRTFNGEILGYIDQTSAWAVKSVGTDLGRCRILTDVYDAVINLVCRDTVYPFNGYWFSIGFCLFFYIPAIILSVKLAKHYRRMRFEEGFDRHGDGMEMADRNKVWHNQGNSVYPR